MGLLIVGSVLSLIGVLFLIVEISIQTSCAQKVTARVIRIEKDSGSYLRGGYRYYPVFAYAVNGKEYVVKDKTSPTRNKNKYKIGAEIDIKCNQQNPQQFRTSAKISNYVISAVLLTIGVTFIVCNFL